jgi:predicted DNA-binding WGR domain protein
VKLIRRVSLGLREGNSDKVYIVDLCEVAGRKFVVNFQFGRRGQPLKDGTKTDAPVAEAVARSIFAKLVEEKTRKGYSESAEASAAAPAPAGARTVVAARGTSKPTREQAILARLRGDSAASRSAWDIGRVAWRAGELRLKAAVQPLLAHLGSGDVRREYCMLWALARCGDESSFPLLVAARKQSPMTPERAIANLEAMLPRTGKSPMLMRVALEMLRAWGDDLKAVVVQRAHGELPPGLRYAAEQGPAEAFTEVLQRSLAAGESAAVLETLYRIDSPIVRPGLVATLRTVALLPGSFRAIRHIFKIAELRGDAEVYGLLALRFELTPHNFSARHSWTYVDGRRTDVRKEQAKADSRLAYGQITRAYLRRRSWATLKRLGTLGAAESYVRMAVGVLLPFTDAHGVEPRNQSHYDYSSRRTTTTHWDRFAPFLAFNHILYDNSRRYELKGTTLLWRCRGNYKPGDAPPEPREEAFPELWQQVPVGLLHLLAESECRVVHEFAVKALRANKVFCDELDLDAIVMLLGRPYEITAQLGYELALARWDANNPDFELVAALASCPVALARQTARSWIDTDRNRFAGARDLMVSLVLSPHADTLYYFI